METPEPDVAAIDMKGNDTLYWVHWRSVLDPTKVYLIGWPMRLHPPQHRVDD